MSSEYECNLPRQLPNAKSVSDMIKNNPNVLNTHLASFLSITIKNNDTNLLNFLLSTNASISNKKVLEEFLLQCVEIGKIDMLRLLLQKGFSPNIQNDYGETPLHIASSKGDCDIVKLLLEYQASANIKTKENLCAYDYAIEQGDKKIIDLLKPRKCNSMFVHPSQNNNCTQRELFPEEIEPGTMNIVKMNHDAGHKRLDEKRDNVVSGNEAMMMMYYFKDSSKRPFRQIDSEKNDIIDVDKEDRFKGYCDVSMTYEDINNIKQFTCSISRDKERKYEDLFYFETDEQKTLDYNISIKPQMSNEIIDVKELTEVIKSSMDREQDDLEYEGYDMHGEEKEGDDDDDDNDGDRDDLARTIPLELNKNNVLNAPFYTNHLTCASHQDHHITDYDTNPSNNPSSSNRKQNNCAIAIKNEEKDKDKNHDDSIIKSYSAFNLISSTNINNAISYNKLSKQRNNNEMFLSTNKEEVFTFLNEIRLAEYTELMLKNGFDDIRLIIDQTRTAIAITDRHLQEAGIVLPGDRAKILIRLQEKAKGFDFDFVKESVYYKPESIDLAISKSDRHIQNLYRFLSTIKMEKYVQNFIKAGYASMDLILVQMLSRQPITELILEKDIKIDKIGYRARILTKFKEEAKNYTTKVKNKNIMIESQKGESEFCNCLIF